MKIAAHPIHHRNLAQFGRTLLVAAAVLTLAAPASVQAESPAAATRLQAKPKPPHPGKEVFDRIKTHSNVGGPGRPSGPSSLKGPSVQLRDWYCGEGSGPGGYAECTKDLINSCSGTYVPPKTNGEHQTWGMCHESTG